MGYISNTGADREEMLAAIGIHDLDDLLVPLPSEIRLKRDLDLPPALDEASLLRHMSDLASRNFDLERHLCFLGAGIYDHFRPSVIGALASRGEFATAYTPYQPEVSQGMLQVTYEYQTLICALTGMDLSNASMYDAATGLAEAALMATNVTNRNEVVVLGSVNPLYREVISTYLASTGFQLIETPWTGDADVDLNDLCQRVSERTACVIAQQPDFWGCIEDIGAIVETAHRSGALAVLSVDPIALGLLKPPASYDVDIVVGEGQSLGNPMAFGGPLLGFFACKKRFLRSFPGRIVGATLDQQGRRGFTMTLRTREQDIRREKATSNICTNQALLALCATIYLTEMGPAGLRQTADLCLQKAHYAQAGLCRLPGVSPLYAGRRFFKEFAVNLPVSPKRLVQKMLSEGFIAGLPLGQYGPELDRALLICVTETKTQDDIDRYVAAVGRCIGEMS